MKLSEILHGFFNAGQARTMSQVLEQMTRQGLAVTLSALMLIVTMGQSGSCPDLCRWHAAGSSAGGRNEWPASHGTTTSVRISCSSWCRRSVLRIHW